MHINSHAPSSNFKFIQDDFECGGVKSRNFQELRATDITNRLTTYS